MMYVIGRWVCRSFLRLFGGYQSIGAENIPRTGGVIVAPNHISYADPPLVGAGMRRQVHFMAKEELFRVPILGRLISSAGAFPVRRGSADRKALRKAIELLENGKVICMFPEGTRSLDGSLGEAQVGIGFVALKSRAPVVPALVVDTEKVLAPSGGRPRYHRTKIIYGEPITFPDLYESPDSRSAIDEIGRRIIKAVANLRDEPVSDRP